MPRIKRLCRSHVANTLQLLGREDLAGWIVLGLMAPVLPQRSQTCSRMKRRFRCRPSEESVGEHIGSHHTPGHRNVIQVSKWTPQLVAVISHGYCQRDMAQMVEICAKEDEPVSRIEKGHPDTEHAHARSALYA
ncbi:hypothetical protein P175DRAFT_0534810 [Aspergillus ochraceoroseus IBT 24754]|uniref:Uncharacterized protein n=1 Tax=Aspergillus ochraceoroseus IBT 24754 TaxID=1392256 RepID=A0A2T5LRX0_9EURO|nr:uncharacterized protein P175DRAFT_0534810 [Aspergillus ochraceoroseus IBT 24754]PTU19021.1 hypothetical protein P175DRAFT_0534810 [Aspergillus ochraceoroseus IBT 24754]